MCTEMMYVLQNCMLQSYVILLSIVTPIHFNFFKKEKKSFYIKAMPYKFLHTLENKITYFL